MFEERIVFKISDATHVCFFVYSLLLSSKFLCFHTLTNFEFDLQTFPSD